MYNKKEVTKMDAINPSKLNKVPQTGAKIRMEKFDDKLSQMVKTLTTRAEREVCEYGSFKIVKESIKNTDANSLVQDLTLQITNLPHVLKGETPNFEKLRYLKLVGTGSKGQSESVILKRGTKDEILNTLKDENFLERIQKNTDEFKTSFMED